MPASAVFLCVGCGIRPVPQKWTYCGTCRLRLSRGETVDQDSIPTYNEERRAKVPRFQYRASRWAWRVPRQ